jgi:hypothetical protein
LTEKILNQSREIDRLSSLNNSSCLLNQEEESLLSDKADEEREVATPEAARMPEMFSIASPEIPANSFLGELSPVSLLQFSPPAEPNCSLGLLSSPVEKVSDDISVFPAAEDVVENVLPSNLDTALLEDKLVQQAHAEPTLEGETEVANYLVESLIDACVEEWAESRKAQAKLSHFDPPARKNRVDAFDPLCSTEQESSSALAELPAAVVTLLSNAAVVALHASDMQSELSQDEMQVLRNLDFGSILSGFSPSYIGPLVSDAFVDILSSLPPAAAADRLWAAKNPGSKSPLSGFLPKSHTLNHLFSQLKSLLEEHCRPVSETTDRVDEVCREFVRKFGLDEVAFQYSTKINSSELNEAETVDQVIEEVKDFIIEAIVTSVAGDFILSSLN